MFSNAQRNFASKGLIMKMDYKICGMKIERFCNIETLHYFYGWVWVAKKCWYKPKTKYLIVFLWKLVLSTVSVTEMTKAALALRFGKSIFVHTIFSMEQLHSEANGKI